MALLDNLNWRYATKKYDAYKKVSENDLATIIAAARLAPSSYGIQPYKIIAISNEELKREIVPIAWNQQIVADCSHLLVFAAWDGYSNDRINSIFNHTTLKRGIPDGSAFGSHTADIIKSQLDFTPGEALLDTTKQACISFGLAIAQAAELKVDSTPMGGFNNGELDRLLGLQQKGLTSIYLLALGYRAQEGDWLVNLEKVRTPEEDFIIKIT